MFVKVKQGIRLGSYTTDELTMFTSTNRREFFSAVDSYFQHEHEISTELLISSKNEVCIVL